MKKEKPKKWLIDKEHRDFFQFSTFKEALENLKSHDHLCLIYETPEEWRATVIPFLLMGLRRGEKCVYIADTHTANQIRRYLDEEGVDTAVVENSGQLVILQQSEVYTKQGSFDPNKVVTFLVKEVKKAITEGYPVLRITGEMSWVLHSFPDSEIISEGILECEAKANRDVFTKYPCVAICQYDRWKFNPKIIKNAIMTHPYLIRGNHIKRHYKYPRESTAY